MTRRPTQSGFSLVELLVTALIFGIGLLGLAALQMSTLRSNSGGRNRFSATALAEGCLSAIQAEGSMSWSYAAGLATGTGPAAYPIPRVFTGNVTAGTYGSFDVSGQPVAAGSPNAIFRVTWAQNAASAAIPSAPITGLNLREFVVTVTWQDQVSATGNPAIPASTLSLSRMIRY